MNRGAVLIVVLLVSSAIAPAGLALGQTDTNTYSKTITGHPDRVVVNQANIDGQFTVEISTTDGPGGSNVTLVREQVGPGAEKYIQFNNQRAYESVTATVTLTDSASGEPTFGDGSDKGFDISYVIGSTGGDRDLTCGTGERINSLTNPYVEVVDCQTLPGTTTVNTTNADAEQVKLDIYQSAQNEKASSEIYQTTLDNKLEGTKTQARIFGKNAYIRALNNGSSEAAAKTAAKDAVANYYAVMQANLIKHWNLKLANAAYLKGVAENESGVDPMFPADGDIYSTYDGGTSNGQYEVSDVTYEHGTESVSLANGSTMDATTMQVTGRLYQVNDDFDDRDSKVVGITTPNNFTTNTQYGPIYWYSLGVNAPNSNFESLTYIDFGAANQRLTEISSQNDAVQSDMDTLVTNTYDEYQAGEINNSDLIDPYVFSQEFSPGDQYQGWAAAQLTMLGTNSPEAMDSIGRFNVSTADGTEHTGVLMSQTNPASGQFAVNQTYDPANISGTQYVVTDESVHELTTPFEIRSIETTDGERRQNVTIEKTTYETADVNTTQLTKLYENLAYERAQWEAREQDLGGGGGGGFLGGGSIDQTVALLALAALAGAALLGNS
ncbi:hypothetical protein [Halomicrobium sp. LC1Hm]|uniref:hypothetical protein n=1 Tax=Halomicrobium sp. LC1Hm TaxID=2610902 RepID=UPI0012A8D520|nr:hypothetical protein [Halomicrobium sp. LC1Hm]QGA84108.1 Uncharacterized protein LC1Hm_3082 [Halomicrobium sp. LC1Hm]